jgi:hypothetical protein
LSNREYVNKLHRGHHHRAAKLLRPSYVVNLLVHDTPNLRAGDIPPALIAAKKQQLLILRQLRGPKYEKR